MGTMGLGRVVGIAMLLISSAHSQYLRGVNLSGAEFGQDEMPGVFGVDYTYITAKPVFDILRPKIWG